MVDASKNPIFTFSSKKERFIWFRDTICLQQRIFYYEVSRGVTAPIMFLCSNRCVPFRNLTIGLLCREFYQGWKFVYMYVHINIWLRKLQVVGQVRIFCFYFLSAFPCVNWGTFRFCETFLLLNIFSFIWFRPIFG